MLIILGFTFIVENFWSGRFVSVWGNYKRSGKMKFVLRKFQGFAGSKEIFESTRCLSRPPEVINLTIEGGPCSNQMQNYQKCEEENKNKPELVLNFSEAFKEFCQN